MNSLKMRNYTRDFVEVVIASCRILISLHSTMHKKILPGILLVAEMLYVICNGHCFPVFLLNWAD